MSDDVDTWKSGTCDNRRSRDVPKILVEIQVSVLHTYVHTHIHDNVIYRVLKHVMRARYKVKLSGVMLDFKIQFIYCHRTDDCYA